jgi:hypothetical protein
MGNVQECRQKIKRLYRFVESKQEKAKEKMSSEISFTFAFAFLRKADT